MARLPSRLAPSARRARFGVLLLALGASAVAEAQPLRPGARVRLAVDGEAPRAWTLGRVHTATGDTLVLDLADGRRFGVSRADVAAIEIDQGRSPLYSLAPASGVLVGLVGGALVGDATYSQRESSMFLEGVGDGAGRIAAGALLGAVGGYVVGSVVGRRVFPVRWEPVGRGPSAPPAALAQVAAPGPEAADDRGRWSVRASLGYAPAAGGGLEGYLVDQGFDDRRDGFGGEIQYPVDTSDEVGWTVAVTREVRPRVRLGGRVLSAADARASGARQGGGRLEVGRTLWAVAPVAEWGVERAYIGGGPALVGGRTGESDLDFDSGTTPDEVLVDPSSFVRPGVVGYAGAGGTLLGGTAYVGLEAQYLWAGTSTLGPFEAGAEAGSARVDQFTVGPVVGVRW